MSILLPTVDDDDGLGIVQYTSVVDHLPCLHEQGLSVAMEFEPIT